MILSLTAIDKEGEFREFSCWFESFEVILDTLSLITSGGGQLLTAEVTEDGSRTSLPVEAFDGQLFSQPIKALEKEWQHVLSEPANFRLVHEQWLLGVIRQQTQRQAAYITRLELGVETMQKRQQQVLDTICQEPLQSRLLNHLEKSLRCFQRHLAIAQLRQRAISGQ